MRTTINIDNELLDKAAKLTGIGEKNCTGETCSRSANRERKRQEARQIGRH